MQKHFRLVMRIVLSVTVISWLTVADVRWPEWRGQPTAATHLRHAETTDARDLLVLRFDNSITGEQGETPAQAGGISFQPGVAGAGAFFATPNQLLYPSANNINAAEGTFECWIKPNWRGNDFQSYYALQYGLGGGILIGKDGANNLRLILNRFGPGGVPEVGVAFNVADWQANQWHYLAFTWSNSAKRLNLYIDGVLKAEESFAINLPAINSPTLQIGADGEGAYVNAVLDELRISDIRRSAQEIRERMQGGPTNGTGLTVREQRMTASISTTSCDLPQTKTVFAPTDTRAFHWMLVSGIRAGELFRWEFIQPNGSLFFTGEGRLNSSGDGCVFSSIPIAGQPAAALPGNWQVRFSYSGVPMLTTNFTISGGGGPMPTPTPPPSTNLGTAVIIDGTDANQHGTVSGGRNTRGWLYMQKALENLASRVPATTAKVVVALGTENGTTARNAIDSAFNLSSLPSAGWTLNHDVDGAANITNWLSGLSTTNTGILYIPTYNLCNTFRVCTGDLEPDEMAAINAQAGQIADFINRSPGNSGALFAMGEVDDGARTGAWGWLRALFPGIAVSANIDSETDLTLTADGREAFPGLTDSAFVLTRGEAWHNYFTGNLGTLKVLADWPRR